MAFDPERPVRVARQLAVVAALLCAATGAAPFARADGAEAAPEVAPVAMLFQRVHAAFPGRILAVELERSDPPAYEVKLLTRNGNVLKLSYNALTLRLDSVVGHRDRADGDPGSRGGRDEPRDGSRDDRDDQDDRDQHDGDGNGGPGDGDDD